MQSHVCATFRGKLSRGSSVSSTRSRTTWDALFCCLLTPRPSFCLRSLRVTTQAQYSAMEWESILEEILSDRRMIDMCEDPNSPKVIICSTIINSVPLQMVLWRNYGYDRDQTPVYKVRRSLQ